MTEQGLAVLRALALRPAQHIAPHIAPIVVALHEAGYILRSADGWIATSEGCRLVEEQRVAPQRH